LFACLEARQHLRLFALTGFGEQLEDFNRMKLAFLWDVALCSLVKQTDVSPLKRRSTSTRLNCVLSQKASYSPLSEPEFSQPRKLKATIESISGAARPCASSHVLDPLSGREVTLSLPLKDRAARMCYQLAVLQCSEPHNLLLLSLP
jgi:hypothetical protein